MLRYIRRWRALRRIGRAPAAALTLALLPLATLAPQARPPTSADARVEALLRQMTLEEKVAEMTQLTIEAVARTHGTATVAQELDSVKLENALVRHNVGSLLNVWDVALTPARWRDLITTVQRFAQRKRLKIPVIYGIDAVHGHHYMVGSTIFPQNLAMAATWNPELVRRTHEITAYETRASGITWNFAPVLDLGRQPLWSRFFETFGEDVYLASVLGRVSVEGEQSRPSGIDGDADIFVAATGKHFLGYSMPLSGKDRTTAWIPDRQLREYFLPTFKTAMEAGLRTVMINSGDINGIPVHASHEILTDLLRHELRFTGVAVTDWEDIKKLVTVHRVAPTQKDAVRMAVMAGIDMSMVPTDLTFYDSLLALAREGVVPRARIDESVRRILKLKFELGLFEHPRADAAMLANVGSTASLAVSRAAADEAVTLLKNDRGILPLAKTARVLVTGPGATSLPAQYGSWSYTWQGTDTAMYPTNVKTLLDAVRTHTTSVTHVQGATFNGEIDIAAAVAAARNADVAIVALAEWPGTEQPGNIDDLTLDEAQLRLARAIEATGTPVVVTLFHDRPRVIRSIVDSARAIVTAYETGPYGGEALAAVLFGDVNPSVKLPFSYPRATGAIAHYDRTSSESYNPEWEFGYGLSYTSFAYSDLKLDRATVTARDTVGITVTVANTGQRQGKEVVQVYVRDLFASVDPPIRRLRDFSKVALAPGERRTVAFRLPISRLAFIGRDNRPIVEPGDFDVIVGNLTRRLTVR